MVTLVGTLSSGTAKPTGMVQFGDRAVLYYEDLRPQVIMPGPAGTLKRYDAGIKPPTAAPSVAENGTAATYVKAGCTLKFVYAFWSPHRGVMSEVSPSASVTVDATKPEQVTVNGFEAPRDNYLSMDITHIYIGVQMVTGMATSQSVAVTGLMCYAPVMVVDCSAGDFTSQSFTFDLNLDHLSLGFNLGRASIYAAVPPAAKFAARHGERIWTAGARESVELDTDTTCAAADATFRESTTCKLTLSGGTSTWNDGHLGMMVLVDGVFAGVIVDVHSSSVAYLDRAKLDTVSASSTDIELRGFNDRLQFSAFSSHGKGNVPIACCETTSRLGYKVIDQINSQPQVVRGLVNADGELHVVLEQGSFVLQGGFEADNPNPTIGPMALGPGVVTERGMCRTDNGESAWLSFSGPRIAGGAGISETAALSECLRMFKGGEWIDPDSLDNAVVGYVPEFDGLLIGNLTVNRTGNHWLLYTRRPQVGFWLMDGQEITSNILVYEDDEGRSVVLAGDSQQGRVKRLLDPDTLLDAQLDDADAPAAFTCRWRQGWSASIDAKKRAAKTIELRGLVLPGSTFSVLFTVWREHFMVRDESDLTAGNAGTVTITQANIQDTVPLDLGSWRYHSVGASWLSSSGSESNRPMELARWWVNYG